MEKIELKKLQDSPEFQAGKKAFLEKKVDKNNAAYFRWYKKLITKKDYASNQSCCILEEQGTGKDKMYMVAFMAVVPPEGCLQITETNQLLILDGFLRARNLHPFVTEEINGNK